MKITKYIFVLLIGMMPLFASAAVLNVQVYGQIYQQFDFDLNEIDPLEAFEFSADFFIDTGASQSTIGNYPQAAFGLLAFVDNNLELNSADFSPGASRDVFVGSSSFGNNEAGVYMQDFFVGNMDLILIAKPAFGDFNNSLSVFDAAVGDAGAVFDLSGFGSQGSVSFGSLQTGSGEYYFDIYDMTVSVANVPIPAAAWLFGSALLGLVGVGRRKKA